jgi:hypothetical protein
MKKTALFILGVTLIASNAYAQANGNLDLNALKNSLLTHSKTAFINVNKNRLAFYGGEDISNRGPAASSLNRQVLVG